MAYTGSTNPFVMRKSIHGRQFGLSSTGALIVGFSAGGVHNSSAHDLAAQMWGSGMIATFSSSEATLNNYGMNVLSSATSTAFTFVVSQPVAGVSMSIWSECSATTITLDTSATTILFQQASTTAASSSTSLSIDMPSTVGGTGGLSVTLWGRSTLQWFVVNKSAGVS